MSIESRATPKAKITLNCDLAETDILNSRSPETQVMSLIDLANISCGAHAGTDEVIKQTLHLAKQSGTQVGAHPSYPDRANFGRKSLSMPKKELKESVIQQVSKLIDMASDVGVNVSYVKPHGALYNDLLRTPSIAKVLLDCVENINQKYDLSLSLMFNACVSEDIIDLASNKGIRILKEAFSDRQYLNSDHLMPRADSQGKANPDAVLSETNAFFQAMMIISDNQVYDKCGRLIKLHADSLCVHGDNPSAIATIKLIHLGTTAPIKINRVGLHALEIKLKSSAHKQLIPALNQKLLSELSDHAIAITAAFDSILIEFEVTTSSISSHLIRVILNASIELKKKNDNGNTSPSGNETNKNANSPKVLPVYYDLDNEYDLQHLADKNKTSVQAIIDKHSDALYQVSAVGFAPGFAYLSGFKSSLSCPRLPSPRTKVPKGAVAIADDLTCVYPQATPGGWNLIGVCPTELFNANESEQPAFLQMGDRVKFEPIDKQKFLELKATSDQDQTNHSSETESQDWTPALKITKAAPQILIQDLGRKLVSQFGLTTGGAMDKMSHSWANRLLGNAQSDATLEVLFGNCTFEILADGFISITGAEATIKLDNSPISCWQVIKVNQGQTLSIGYIKSGLRVYLGIQGGIKSSTFWSSQSCVPRENIGEELSQDSLIYKSETDEEQTLAKRDTAIRSLAHQYLPKYNKNITLRIILNNDALQYFESAIAKLNDVQFVVAPNSDRMGIRLVSQTNDSAPEQKSLFEHEINITSCGVPFGTIQIPPNGNPIVMMADRQTIGGYPQLGTVISSDCYRLAQAQPGTAVKLQLVAPQHAQEIESQFNQWMLFSNEH